MKNITFYLFWHRNVLKMPESGERKIYFPWTTFWLLSFCFLSVSNGWKFFLPLAIIMYYDDGSFLTFCMTINLTWRNSFSRFSFFLILCCRSFVLERKRSGELVPKDHLRSKSFCLKCIQFPVIKPLNKNCFSSFSIADFICADISLSSLGKNSFNSYTDSHSKWNLVSNVTTQIGTHAYLPCKVSVDVVHERNTRDWQHFVGFLVSFLII